jgi:hypothetical protein
MFSKPRASHAGAFRRLGIDNHITKHNCFLLCADMTNIHQPQLCRFTDRAINTELPMDSISFLKNSIAYQKDTVKLR